MTGEIPKLPVVLPTRMFAAMEAHSLDFHGQPIEELAEVNPLQVYEYVRASATQKVETLNAMELRRFDDIPENFLTQYDEPKLISRKLIDRVMPQIPTQPTEVIVKVGEVPTNPFRFNLHRALHNGKQRKDVFQHVLSFVVEPPHSEAN